MGSKSLRLALVGSLSNSLPTGHITLDMAIFPLDYRNAPYMGLSLRVLEKLEPVHNTTMMWLDYLITLVLKELCSLSALPGPDFKEVETMLKALNGLRHQHWRGCFS